LADWDAIVREHGPAAARAAFRVVGHAGDAEDALQEALLDALRLHVQQDVRNWGGLLRRLAVCRALDVLRRRQAASELERNAPAAHDAARPEAVAVAHERAALLRSALARLTEREAEVFSLRYFGDLDNAQIAGALDIPPGAVAVALHKARARLQELFDKEH
jgi:RNA polymerase sigma-70 factor (ECF subfamily)